jgi:hypothetical protein
VVEEVEHVQLVLSRWFSGRFRRRWRNNWINRNRRSRKYSPSSTSTRKFWRNYFWY